MGQSLRLLLIEDDAKAATLLCDRFRAEGVAIEHAANGADGLALAQKGGFDVLVVDRMLPELSGTQVVENLRQAAMPHRFCFSRRWVRLMTGSPDLKPVAMII